MPFVPLETGCIYVYPIVWTFLVDYGLLVVAYCVHVHTFQTHTSGWDSTNINANENFIQFKWIYTRDNFISTTFKYQAVKEPNSFLFYPTFSFQFETSLISGLHDIDNQC